MKSNRQFWLKNNNKGSAGIAVLGVFMVLSLCVLGVLVAILLLKNNADRKYAQNMTQNSSGQTSDSDYADVSDTSSEQPPETPEQVTEVTLSAIDDDFYIKAITDDIFSRMDGYSFNSMSPVAREDLRYVHILHLGVDGRLHEGELIVHRAIAEDVLDVFYELYGIGYVIESVELVDNFEADDNVSMTVNNTSAFNARNIDGTDVISNHAYGLAIDINPLYNPYVVNDDVILPVPARRYADRTQDFNMKIDEEDDCYRIFTKHGFTWGGSWENVKDYMHFEKIPKKFEK